MRCLFLCMVAIGAPPMCLAQSGRLEAAPGPRSSTAQRLVRVSFVVGADLRQGLVDGVAWADLSVGRRL